MSSNPLQKYFRQPKIFINLPSKGLYYKPGSLEGDYNNVPIFAMTGMDEIIMKTPDALFTGEATIKLIESCCPYIKNAKNIPSLDIDALLVSIRISTFGETMTVTNSCKKCGSDNSYDINLSSILEHYKDKTYDNILHAGDLTINFRPLTYEEMAKFNIDNFTIQKTLSQIPGLSDDQRQVFLDKIYKDLAMLQLELILISIESITTPDGIVSDKEFIKEWLGNSVRDNFKLIKEKLEKNKEDWKIPEYQVKCVDCGNDNSLEIELDQSNFFE